MTHSPQAIPVVPLLEFCKPKQWPTIPQSAFVDEGYPVYGANGKIGYYTAYNHEKPTVLITCRGATCGKINVCEPKSYVTGNSMALDDLDESRVAADYLVYALRHGSLSRAISGTAQPQITRQSLGVISIPLPPLFEQRRIALILDQAEALRAKRRAALQELEALSQSIFLEMFGDPMANPKGWQTCQLQDVSTKITDGTHKTPSYVDSGVEFLSAKDLREGGVAWGTGKFISEEEHGELVKRCNPELGDILLAKSGSLGSVAIIDRSHQFSLFESLCLIKHNRERVEGRFLIGLLRTPSMLVHLLGKNKGVAIKHLHLVEVRNLRLPLPPLSLQQEFSGRVMAIEKLQAAHKASLAELDALFASLQHRAFRGELFA